MISLSVVLLSTSPFFLLSSTLKVVDVSPITGTPLSSWRNSSAILRLTSVVRVLGLMNSGGNAVHPFLGERVYSAGRVLLP
jgi:hypothetical protein